MSPPACNKHHTRPPAAHTIRCLHPQSTHSPANQEKAVKPTNTLTTHRGVRPLPHTCQPSPPHSHDLAWMHIGRSPYMASQSEAGHSAELTLWGPLSAPGINKKLHSGSPPPTAFFFPGSAVPQRSSTTSPWPRGSLMSFASNWTRSSPPTIAY
jgi:hypothetical protein